MDRGTSLAAFNSDGHEVPRAHLFTMPSTIIYYLRLSSIIYTEQLFITLTIARASATIAQ
jgi:hypothetical protein